MNLNGKSFLVVDDEDAIREIVMDELKFFGANVAEANSGKAAYSHLVSHPVDVIISDIRMPGGDGIELLESVRAHLKHNPIMVFMTGYSDISKEMAYDKGIDAIFGKPFEIEEILETTESLMIPLEERVAKVIAADGLPFLEKTYDNFQTAVETNQIALGRGGLFIEATENFPAPGDVQFKFNFGSGPIHCIKGSGKVRWVRKNPKDNLSQGFGLEIGSLEDSSRNFLCTALKGTTGTAFIPSGRRSP